MPKHYRPPVSYFRIPRRSLMACLVGKKREGNASKHITRSQAVKYLQVSLTVFRQLCVYKGVFPREPKKKVKGNHHTYYHIKDILFLKHDTLIEILRARRACKKKTKKAEAKKNLDLVERLNRQKPPLDLNRIVIERGVLAPVLIMTFSMCFFDRANIFKLNEFIRVEDCVMSGKPIFLAHINYRKPSFLLKAEVQRQTISWLTPHALQQVLSPEIDYKIMLTFLDVHELINVEYPPILDPRLEALAAMSFYAVGVMQIFTPCQDTLMPMLGESWWSRCFFSQLLLHVHVPMESLLFVIPAFGGVVSWEGEGAPFPESDQNITHQIVDRPTQRRKFLPETMFSHRPPHLSPFIDNEAEGHVPEYAENIKRLQAAARNKVLPMPGVGEEDFGDPQKLLGIIDRAEKIEAAEKKTEDPFGCVTSGSILRIITSHLRHHITSIYEKVHFRRKLRGYDCDKQHWQAVRSVLSKLNCRFGMRGFFNTQLGSDFYSLGYPTSSARIASVI
ncbi:pescadillo-related [Abeliophyllum distichum]|uniref:Pescadillo-related n=1 Tax=Abeliophyllum distichum TaxID=126358 RepID=A0ABD1SXR2_9LAMI